MTSFLFPRLSLPCMNTPTPTHTLTQSFPSSLWMAFPGPQHAQEIGSVIVYVCGENATAVFLAVVSWPTYLTTLLPGKAEQRRSLFSFLLCGLCCRTTNRSQFGSVLQELTWTELIPND